MIHIVNRHRPPYPMKGVGVYVGRGSPLGNPYGATSHAPIVVGSRMEAIHEYKKYLAKKIREKDACICNELNRIYRLAKVGDVSLICSCHPLPCHADVIKEVIEKKINDSTNSKV